MTAVAFLGLGTMGYPMAGHLQREGYDVCVYNRSSAKALRWVEEYAGRRADTPREACAGAELVFCCVGNDDDLRAVALGEHGQTRVVFVANPNNPTGTWFGADALERFLAQVPAEVLVVLDEAYIEYAEGDELPDGLDYLARHPNLLVSRTFSKAYGLASLRVGYALSSKAVADVLNRVRQPFNVNSLALAAACAALDDHDYLAQSRRLNDSGMAQLEDGFHALGLSWIPSKGNFIAVDLARDAGPVYQALLREGVIVRPVAGYGMPTFLRVSIGLPEENDRFLQALGKVLAHD